MSHTAFLCDLVDVSDRRITLDDLRARWSEGKYTGVSDEFARFSINFAGVGRG